MDVMVKRNENVKWEERGYLLYGPAPDGREREMDFYITTPSTGPIERPLGVSVLKVIGIDLQ